MKLYLIPLIVLACAVSGGCLPLPEELPSTGGIRYASSCTCRPRRGVNSGLAYAPDNLWSGVRVDVCFSGGTAAQQSWIRDAVDRTWGSASALQVAWVPCGPRAVAISIGDALEVPAIGSKLAGREVVLGSLPNDEYHLRTQAVFAFGFVLGFAAAQDRYDAECPGRRWFPAGAYRVIGSWDERSAMNQCRSSYGLLSEGDIAGVQKLYGEAASCSCP